MAEIIDTNPKYTIDELMDIAQDWELDPFDYEVRTTQFKDCYKIIDKKSKVRYTSGIEKIKENVILYKNITDKKYFNRRRLDFKREGSDINIHYNFYQFELIGIIYNMFTVIELFYSHLLDDKEN